MSLPKLSIQRPVLTSMFFLGIVLIGIISFRLLPVEMMPNMSFGHITIYINIRGGIPASDVEETVSKVVEEAVGSVSHLKNILSISKEGNSTIILEFEPGINMDFAALEVREKFNRIRNKLPKEIEKPVVAKYEYTDVPILIVAATSNVRSAEDIRKIVDEKIKPNIQRIEGVARVEVAGGRESKVLVEIDKYKLQSFSLPINAIVDVISINNLNLLAGEIKKATDKYLVRTIGEFQDLEDIGNLAIVTTKDGSIIRIKDIAKVEDSYLDPTSFSRVNAQAAVSLYIQKESLANTVKVASLIEKEVWRLRETLDKDIQISLTSNQAEYIKKAIQGVKISLFLGALLAFFILFIFLRDIFTITVIGITIPASILFTFIFMWISRLSVNLMTLSGLALGVGMVVDSSIVVIENIFKKIENISKAKQKDKEEFLPAGDTGKNASAASVNSEIPPENEPVKNSFFSLGKDIKKSICAAGAEEMLLAIVASTATTLAVFTPLVFINPETKILYSGLALTISFALCSSLLCALTLVPMFISQIKTNIRTSVKKNIKKRIEILPFYEKILKKCLKFRYLVIGGSIAVFIISIGQMNKLEREFIGIAEQNKFTIFIEMPTGTRLDVTDKIVKHIEKIVAKMEEVQNVTAKVEPWSSKIYVVLKPLNKRELSTPEVIEKIRPYAEKLKSAFIYFEEPQEVGTKEILLEIFGYDYEVLKDIAVKTAQRIQAVPEFTDTKIRMREGRPEMHVNINKDKAAMLGLTVQNIALSLHTQLRGLVATRYRGIREPLIRMRQDKPYSPPSVKDFIYSKEEKEEKEIESIVRLDEMFRQKFDDVKRMNLVTPDGELIYLTQVADFKFDIGPSEIWRKNKARMVQVSANTGGLALGTAGERVKEVLKDMKLPKDYFWQLGGNYEKMLRNQRELTFAVVLSIILIYMILASLYESFIQPFIILIAVPFALIGAVFALRITRNPISIGAMMGVIMLGGIVVNNAIILIDRINFLKRKIQGETFDIVVQASMDRLRPIIITSLTTIASMLFLAIDRSESSPLWSPLAITVIGGMSISTILTLLLVPCLYSIFDDFKLLTKYRR